MNVTVVWSGGYDSTAALIHYLQDKDTCVYPLAVCLSNNAAQVAAESRSRRQLWELLSHEFGQRLQPLCELPWPPLEPDRFELGQPLIWVTAAAHFAETADVAFGWVRGDDVWHYRTPLLQVVDAMAPFLKVKPVINLPFEWCTKDELLRYYQGRLEVFHHLTSSEQGTPWSLGTDPKCIELRRLASLLTNLPAPKVCDSTAATAG